MAVCNACWGSGKTGDGYQCSHCGGSGNIYRKIVEKLYRFSLKKDL